MLRLGIDSAFFDKPYIFLFPPIQPKHALLINTTDYPMLTISILNTHLDEHNLFSYEYSRDIEDGSNRAAEKFPPGLE